MRFLLITAQCFVMIFAAQIVALGVILVYPEANFSKTMLIAFVPSMFIFGLLFKHSRSRIWDLFSLMGRPYAIPDSIGEFLLGLYTAILLMFLFTLSLSLSLDKLLRFL